MLKGCVLALVTPTFGDEGTAPTAGELQRLKNDALWFDVPSQHVKVNPFWAGWNPLSATGPNEEAKAKGWVHKPVNLADFYHKYLVRSTTNKQWFGRWGIAWGGRTKSDSDNLFLACLLVS